MDNKILKAHRENQKKVVESIVQLSKTLEGLMDNLTVATMGMDRISEIVYNRNLIQDNRKTFELIESELNLEIANLTVEDELPQSTP